MLQGKKIILGVCGSIAAYKAAMLVRQLIKAEAEVQVVMTTSASAFITPLTLATLSKRPVLSEFVRDETGTWNNHVDLGLWADALVVAPASANTVAKIVNGFCDNLLSAIYLSARCPVFVAPAMDLDMYRHPAVQNNFVKLQSYGNHIIEAGYGELASGLVGQGRMAEPEEIVQVLQNFFGGDTKLFEGKTILLTAGPTQEPIDPVRFIGNHSTGKMGYALAEGFAKRGAIVHLVAGPTSLKAQHPYINLTNVTTADEMYAAALQLADAADIWVFAAAVADYRPKTVADKKIKKTGNELTIELVKNVDIAAALGQRKKPGQFSVGFALETHDERDNAREKLQKKNLNMIVLNSLNDAGAGFRHDTNKITIIEQNATTAFELKLKAEVAEDIINLIWDRLHG